MKDVLNCLMQLYHWHLATAVLCNGSFQKRSIPSPYTKFVLSEDVINVFFTPVKYMHISEVGIGATSQVIHKGDVDVTGMTQCNRNSLFYSAQSTSLD